MNHPALTPIACVALAVCAGAVGAGDESALRDWQLTAQARRALAAAPILDECNVGVRVRDRVATLWGSVPTEGLRRRAEEVVRKVPGLVEVHSELKVDAADVLAAPPELTPPATPLRLTGRDESAKLDSRPTASWDDRAPRAPSLPLRPDVAPRGPAAVLLAPLVDMPDGLDDSVATLCRSNDRYRGLQADVHDGVVRLKGTVRHWPDLWEVAKSLARLPGVSRVLVDQVRGPQ
jgi:hypothetical protein